MSTLVDDENSANKGNIEKVNSLKLIAYNVLEPNAFEKLENYTLDEISEAVYDQYYGDKHPRVQKVDSKVSIDLEEDEFIKTENLESTTDIWVFGYGSLIWKVDFPYLARKAGYIKGYERKFYQNSIDHRGLPEKPGRVVTLIPSKSPTAKVWGVGYRISTQVKNSVVKSLDHREKNGYDRLPVLFYEYRMKEISEKTIKMIAYVASEDNSSYAGHISDMDDIVNQIFEAVGPSGTNREYVYKLANAMRILFPDATDDHLSELESKLREKEQKHTALVDKVKGEIKSIIEHGILSSKPIGEIRMDLKNLYPHISFEKE